MPLKRRRFLQSLAAGAAVGAFPASSLAAEQPATRSARKVGAIAFDAYGTLFDVNSVISLGEQLFPGQGKELSQIWRTKQLEYTWLRTMSRRYADFWKVTEDGLAFAAKRLKLDLTADKRAQMMNAYLRLDPFPENIDALKTLKSAGIRLAILSNGTPTMLNAAVKSSGMEGIFDHILSVDTVRLFKTDPRVYQLGVDAFKLKPSEIVFVSSNSWDVAGAAWFGYTTFWVNRAKAPVEELGVTPTKAGNRLTDLVEFVKAS